MASTLAAVAVTGVLGCGGGARDAAPRSVAAAPPAVADPPAAVRAAVLAAEGTGRSAELVTRVDVRGADQLSAADRRRLDRLLPPLRRASERVDAAGRVALETSAARVFAEPGDGAVLIGAPGAPWRRAPAAAAEGVRAAQRAGREALSALAAPGLRVAAARGGTVRLRAAPAPDALLRTVLPTAGAARALQVQRSSLEVTLRDGALTGWRVALRGRVDLGRLARSAARAPAAVGAVLSVTEQPSSAMLTPPRVA